MAASRLRIQKIHRNGRASVLARCGICQRMVSASTLLSEHEFIKHTVGRERHLIGTLRQRRGLWVVDDPPEGAIPKPKPKPRYDPNPSKASSVVPIYTHGFEGSRRRH